MAGYQNTPRTDSPNVQQMESGRWWTRTVCPSMNVCSTVKCCCYIAVLLFCHSWKHVEVTVYTNVFIFNSSEMVILVFLKATKSGTPALIINQAFIFSIMWFDYILFEVSKPDEVELLIADSIKPNHRQWYLDISVDCLTSKIIREPLKCWY